MTPDPEQAEPDHGQGGDRLAALVAKHDARCADGPACDQFAVIVELILAMEARGAPA